MKPLITLLKQKEKYYESAISQLLKEEIPRSLQGTDYSQVRQASQVPVCWSESFTHVC